MVLYVIFSSVLTLFTETFVYCGIHILKYGLYDQDSMYRLENMEGNLPERRFRISEIFRITAFEQANVCISIIIFLILFFLFYELLSRSLVEEIHAILQGISNMKEGDLYEDINIKSQDEIGQLASSINEMKNSLRKLMEQERDVEQTKNDLITNVAHDLRTPLTSIRGYVDLLKKENLSEVERKKYIQVIAAKTEHLQSLIESLFEYTKFCGGEIQLIMKPLDVSCFMEQMVDEFYPDFQNASLETEIEIAPNLYVLGDGEKLARAFSNIMANAIKYGADGKLIKVWVYEKENHQEKQVVVDVVNYGRIIEKDDLKRIFDKFYRVESSRSLNTGGAGLGLVITRDIIERHGGMVTAQSDEKGTILRVVMKEYEVEGN